MDCSNTAAGKQPKSVAIALWWLSIYAAFNFISGFLSYPYPSCPWTCHAENFVMFLLLAYCGRQVQKRNLISVSITLGSLLLSALILYDFVPALIFSGVPFVLLVLPQCVCWLKSNSCFSFGTPIFGGILVLGCAVFHYMPSITANDISNRNPICFFKLGSEPMHELDESGRHSYVYWWRSYAIGTCNVFYDKDNKCCRVCLNFGCPGEKTVEEYNDYFFKRMKEECVRHFGTGVFWSSETVDGFGILTGKTEDNVVIQIGPNPNKETYGSVVISSADAHIVDSLPFLDGLFGMKLGSLLPENSGERGAADGSRVQVFEPQKRFLDFNAYVVQCLPMSRKVCLITGWKEYKEFDDAKGCFELVAGLLEKKYEMSLADMMSKYANDEGSTKRDQVLQSGVMIFCGGTRSIEVQCVRDVGRGTFRVRVCASDLGLLRALGAEVKRLNLGAEAEALDAL